MSSRLAKPCAAIPGCLAQILSDQADDRLASLHTSHLQVFARSAAIAGMDSFESTVNETLTSEVETTSTATVVPIEDLEDRSQKSVGQQHARRG